MPQSWEITIDRFEGLTPAFAENAYPTIGNRGHASAMQNVDVFDGGVLTQGPGLADLTNGNQAGVVTTLVRGMTRVPPASSTAYGVGGARLYKLSGTEVASDASFPRTIDKAAVTGEDGEDVALYKGAIFYSYNHSGSAGDVGKLTLPSTFDDDYMSTVPTGAAALQDGPHQMVVGGDDILYIANGRYIASLNNTTFTAQALDFPQGSSVVSLAWHGNRVYANVNFPGIAGGHQDESTIYVWDTFSTSWEYQIRVMGRLGALYVKNGLIFVFYEDISLTGGYNLGVVSNGAIQELAAFSGTLPRYFQVSEHKNHLIWNTDGKVYAWGAYAPGLATKLFQLASTGHSSAGGITNGFGTPIIASQSGASYRLAKFSGYDVTCSWKSLVFDVSRAKHTSFVDRVVIETEPLSTGAKLDTTLTYDYGKGSRSLAQVAYSADNHTRHVVMRDEQRIENFRLDLSWANGSTTNPVKVRKIIVSGYFSDDA